MVLLKWAAAGERQLYENFNKRAMKQLFLAMLLAVTVVWAGYGFAVGHVDESMDLSAASMPSFQHFPAAVGRVGRYLILSDPRVPAPALVRGLATAWVLNKTHPPAYLLGHIREGGWWYFFLLGVAVKSTISLLVLAIVGSIAGWIAISSRRLATYGRWTGLAPVVSILSILLVTMPVKYNAGVRHVLVVFPLMAIVAGHGCQYLWNLNGGRRTWGRGAVLALLACQCVSSARASNDYLAYFNAFAGKDPSKILVAGCDLDCGQDLFALSTELRTRQVSHVSLALWTSADMTKIDLPSFDIPQPYQPVTGWFAISLRALRFGDLFHTTYPPEAFAWLERYEPVAHIGKTILLYYIPETMPEEKQ